MGSGSVSTVRIALQTKEEEHSTMDEHEFFVEGTDEREYKPNSRRHKAETAAFWAAEFLRTGEYEKAEIQAANAHIFIKEYNEDASQEEGGLHDE